MVKAFKKRHYRKTNMHQIVPIKDSLSDGNPISTLPSKFITATIFAYVARQPDVCRILQTLSH